MVPGLTRCLHYLDSINKLLCIPSRIEKYAKPFGISKRALEACYNMLGDPQCEIRLHHIREETLSHSHGHGALFSPYFSRHLFGHSWDCRAVALRYWNGSNRTLHFRQLAISNNLKQRPCLETFLHSLRNSTGMVHERGQQTVLCRLIGPPVIVSNVARQ